MNCWRAPVVITVVCLLCYVNALDGTFHYDDFHSIVDNPGIRSLENIPGFFWDTTLFSVDESKGMYRPLLLLTYALNYAIGGYASPGYQAVNLFLHVACSVLVWAIAAVLFRQSSIALMCGLVFAVHPMATEPVNYVSSRSELLAGMLYLGSFLTYLAAQRAATLRHLSIVLFALGLLSKATVVTLPLVLLVYDLCLVERVRDLSAAVSVVRARWRAYTPYWALVLLYFWLIKSVGFIDRSLAAPVRDWGTQLWTQTKAPAYYAKLMVMPIGQNVEHQFFESPSPASGVVVMGTFLVMSILGILWLTRARVGGFCVGWCVIFLLPTLVMPLNVLVNERRLYLVAVGFAWLLGDLLCRRQARAVLVCVPLFALLTMARNEVWGSELTLWRDAVSKAPSMYRTQTNLGKALQVAGAEDEALEAYERAMVIDSRHGDVYNNIATLLHRQGRIDEAIGWYRKALDRYPDSEEVYQNLADAYSEKGHLDTAAALYASAVEIDDRNGALWANYGQTLYRNGDLEGAEEALRRSLNLLPQQGEPYNNLGNIYVDRGDFDQALSFYSQAVDLGVDQIGDVRSNIGDLHRERGDVDQARSAYEQAIDADPANAAHYQRLGVVERSLGNNLAAEALFREAIDRRSSYWKAHTELAEVLALGGQTAEAIEHFRLATAGDPSYDRAWFGLARGLDEIDRLEEAIVAYETFLRTWRHRDRRYQEVADRLRVLRHGE